MKYSILLLVILGVCCEQIIRKSDIYVRQGDWQTWIYNKFDKNLTNNQNIPPYQITTVYDDYWSLKFNNAHLPPLLVQTQAKITYMKSLSERIDTPSPFKFKLWVSLENAPIYTNFINYFFLKYNEYDGGAPHHVDLVLWNSQVRAPEKIDRYVFIDNKAFYICYLSRKHTKIFFFNTSRVYDDHFDLQPFQSYLLKQNRIRYNARLVGMHYQIFANQSGTLKFSTEALKINKDCITTPDSRLFGGLNFVNDIKRMDYARVDFSNMSIPIESGSPQAHFQYQHLNPFNPDLCNAEQYVVVGYNRGKWVTDRGVLNLPIRVKQLKSVKFNFSFSEAENQAYRIPASRTAFMKIQLDQNINLNGQPSDRIYVSPFYSGPEIKKGKRDGLAYVNGRTYTRYYINQRDQRGSWNEYYFYAHDITNNVEDFELRSFINEIKEYQPRNLHLIAVQVGFQFYNGQAICTFNNVGFSVEHN